MTPVPPHDPAAALNEVLSEVVDLVLAVRRARHAVREGQELDTELHRLFTSGRTWSELLMDVDTALGVSALAYMPTPTARRAPSLGAAHLTDDEVRRGVAVGVPPLPDGAATVSIPASG